MPLHGRSSGGAGGGRRARDGLGEVGAERTRRRRGVRDPLGGCGEPAGPPREVEGDRSGEPGHAVTWHGDLGAERGPRGRRAAGHNGRGGGRGAAAGQRAGSRWPSRAGSIRSGGTSHRDGSARAATSGRGHLGQACGREWCRAAARSGEVGRAGPRRCPCAPSAEVARRSQGGTKAGAEQAAALRIARVLSAAEQHHALVLHGVRDAGALGAAHPPVPTAWGRLTPWPCRAWSSPVEEELRARPRRHGAWAGARRWSRAWVAWWPFCPARSSSSRPSPARPLGRGR